MTSDRCRVLKEGILDVKFPPDSPERVLNKAWRKLWARAIVLYPPGRGEPHLIIQLKRSSLDKQLQTVKASRDGLRLFRCRSKSRPLQTWALSSGSTILVYLAGEDELETQTWMQAIRNGLWPPIHNISNSYHDVSLIDDEKSSSSGILGLYGRLVRTSDDMVSIIHPYWQGMLLRWKQEDILDVNLVRKVGGEGSTAGVFKLMINSTKKEGRSLHFYSDSAVAAVNWIKKIENSVATVNESAEKTIPSLILSDESEVLQSNIESEYATVKKITKMQPESTQEAINAQNSNQEEITPEKNNLEKLKLENIPSEFLNTSISSICLPREASSDLSSDSPSPLQVDNEGDSDSSVEMYEHLYEDVVSRTESVGACTLYEEIDDADSEYVPPLPPQLPNRPMNEPSLRLLKLSESVAEALKLAEEAPSLPVQPQHRPGLLNKVVGKKSKLLASSQSIETHLEVVKTKNSELKRTKSAPNANKPPATKIKQRQTSVRDKHRNQQAVLETSLRKEISEYHTTEMTLNSNETSSAESYSKENSNKNFEQKDNRDVNKDKVPLQKEQSVEGDYMNMR